MNQCVCVIMFRLFVDVSFIGVFCKLNIQHLRTSLSWC